MKYGVQPNPQRAVSRRPAWLAALAVIVLGSAILATDATKASATAATLPGGTTTTTIFDDGGDPPPVVLAPMDPTIDEFVSKYPGVLIPTVISLKVLWSSGPLSASAETAQRTRVANARTSLASVIAAVPVPAGTPASEIATKQAGIAPVMAAGLTPAAVAALRAQPLVRAISYDRLAGPADDQLLAPPIATSSPQARTNLSVTDTQRIMKADVLHAGEPGGGDITGNGTVVAFIDTGINPTVGGTGAGSLVGKVVDGVCLSTSYGSEPGICPKPLPSSNGTYAEGAAYSGECTSAILGATAQLATEWWCGHGTGVAQNSVGGSSVDGVKWGGVAPEAKLLSISGYHFTQNCVNGELVFVLPGILGPPTGPTTGTFWCGGVRQSDLYTAFDWVFSRRNTFNIAAINMSMGWFNEAANDADCDSASVMVQDLKGMVDLLRGANIAAVGAAGNWNTPTKRPRIFPSCISSVVSSGVTTWINGNIASEAPAANGQGSTGLDLLAPGRINDTVGATSGSTAHTSASFALLRQAAPWATVDQVENALKLTGNMLYMPNANWPATYTTVAQKSKPRINLQLAVAQLRTGLAVKPVTQARIADSRLASSDPKRGATCPASPTAPLGVFGQATQGATQRLRVLGVGGVPTDARGVVINLTVTQPSTSSFATVWGANPVTGAAAAMPQSSTLNWAAGDTVSNSITAVPDGQGCISIFNQLGTAHVIVDVMGYLSSTASDGSMTMLGTPQRSPDSGVRRSGNFEMRVAGVNGVPTDATAVWVSITATQSTAGSVAAIAPATSPSTYPNPLATSNINFPASSQTSSLALVKVGAGGKVAVSNALGSAVFELDVLGYQSPASTQRLYLTQLQRIKDTRCAGTVVWCSGVTGTAIGTGGLAVSIPATAGLAAGATGALANITTTRGTQTAHVTAWNGQGSVPWISQAQVNLGRDRAAATLIPLASGGFKLTPGAGQTHLVVDLIGYVR